jgi:hypothetical protein
MVRLDLRAVRLQITKKSHATRLASLISLYLATVVV